MKVRKEELREELIRLSEKLKGLKSLDELKITNKFKKAFKNYLKKLK
jgi:hypothetical protein